MTERKTTRKMCPCPSYDIEGIESWLTDMAAEGWILDKDCWIVFGVFGFKKEEPQRYSYRLEPAPGKGSFFDSDNDKSSCEQVEIARTYGWEYVLQYSNFYIYYTADMETRELNTDSEVQAFAIDIVKKRQRSNLIVNTICFLLQVYIICQGNFIIYMLDVGVGIYILFMAIFIWGLVGNVTEIIHLDKLCKQLKEDGYMNHNKKWKRSKYKYRARNIMGKVGIIAWIIYLICLIHGQENIVRSDIAFYDKELPFTSLRDICGDGEYTRTENPYWAEDNTYYEWENGISTYNITWMENGINETPDGMSVEYSYNVRYYELKSEWIANFGAKEFTKYYTANNFFNDYTYYEPTTAPDVDVDYIRTFTSITSEYMCIIQDGNILIVARLSQDSREEGIDVEEWVASLKIR